MIKEWKRQFYSIPTAAVLAVCLVGCSSHSTHPTAPLDRRDQARRNFGSLLDDGGFSLFGGNKNKTSSNDGPTANSYLWRAGLESLRFLPLASADVRGGVVVSDWYAFPERPNERLKVSMFVKSPELKAEALEITVHRQKGTGTVTRDDAKAREIEDLIVKRARSMYIESKGSK